MGERVKNIPGRGAKMRCPAHQNHERPRLVAFGLVPSGHLMREEESKDQGRARTRSIVCRSHLQASPLSGFPLHTA